MSSGQIQAQLKYQVELDQLYTRLRLLVNLFGSSIIELTDKLIEYVREPIIQLPVELCNLAIEL